MMNKITFFKTIEKTLEQTTFEDIINYDEMLIKELKNKTNSEIAQFHMCMLELRRGLDTFEIIKVASSLDLAPNREIFNRFCNGIIASGKDFYIQTKEGKGFLETKLQNNPEDIKQLYYEQKYKTGRSNSPVFFFWIRTDSEGVLWQDRF